MDKDTWIESIQTESIKLRIFLSNHLKKYMIDIITIHFLGWNYNKNPILTG